MDQAVPDELYSDLSVRGFEALFEPVTESIPVTNTGARTDADIDPVSVIRPEYEEGDATWTLRAASERLGLSPNTIRKRIRTGQLRADKVIGFNGPEWKIYPPKQVVQQTPLMLQTPQTHAGYASYATIGDPIAAGTPTASNDQITFETLLKIVEAQAKQLEIATTQLAASTEHVKAATRVIAYQQLQLEEKNNKVKLLTDSHHHDNWFVKLARKLKNSQG